MPLPYFQDTDAASSLPLLASPSSRSLFSVRSGSSSLSTSSTASSIEISRSSFLNSNFNKKLKNGLKRSNSLWSNNKDPRKISKKLISSPIPITAIPVRQGDIDLTNVSLQRKGSLQQSLKSNKNYFFNKQLLLCLLKEGPSHFSDSVAEENQEDNEFYFMTKKEGYSKRKSMSPFDVIFDSSFQVPVGRPVTYCGSRTSDNTKQASNFYYGSLNTSDLRVSSDSGRASLVKRVLTFKSSRITLDKLKIQTSAEHGPEGCQRSPNISLYTPTKHNFQKNSSLQQQQQRLGSSEIISDSNEPNLSPKARRPEKIYGKFDIEQPYESNDVYCATQTATTILKQTEVKPFFGCTKIVPNWL